MGVHRVKDKITSTSCCLLTNFLLRAKPRARHCIRLTPIRLSPRSVLPSHLRDEQIQSSVQLSSHGASQAALVTKNPLPNSGDERDVGSIPGWGRYPRGGHGNPLQYSCLENPLNRGAWQATIHRFAESDMTEATEHALQVTGKQSPSQGLRFIYKFSCSSCATLTPLILVCMRTKKP